VDARFPENTSGHIKEVRREKTLASTGKKSLTLEEKIEEYKAFLRDFQRFMGPKRLDQRGNVATIDRRLIMIDALVATAQTELQQNYSVHTLADYLFILFTAVRDSRITANPKVLAVEAEYQRRGGTGLNERHSVVFFTTGSLYEHISGKELSARQGWRIVARNSAWFCMIRLQPGNSL
jgi:hypothetical protein